MYCNKMDESGAPGHSCRQAFTPLCVACEGDQLQEKLGIDTDPRDLGDKLKSGAKSALPFSLQLEACIVLSCPAPAV